MSPLARHQSALNATRAEEDHPRVKSPQDLNLNAIHRIEPRGAFVFALNRAFLFGRLARINQKDHVLTSFRVARVGSRLIFHREI
jgi:hypothetical protein